MYQMTIIFRRGPAPSQGLDPRRAALLKEA